MLGFGLSSKPISCSNGKRSADSARLVTVVLLLRSIAAGALCAALTDTAQAGPDLWTGIGTVTCSGNQSAGVANPPFGTTILNVNSLTSDIRPTNGQPGIVFESFESNNDITLNSDTKPYTKQCWHSHMPGSFRLDDAVMGGLPLVHNLRLEKINSATQSLSWILRRLNSPK
jgi:hypothetical protein